MGTNFESKLNKAIGKCEEYFIPESSKFERIYPFITENFTGYEELFELENKSLLTVGSSCDQAINANYYGCKDITIIDLCPYTKEYFYLKKAALLTLSYSDFFEFFCYRDYPKTFKDNKHILNRTAYRSMESILRNLDYESYLFWGELLENFPGERVRRKLFSNDEDKFAILKDKNPYLKDETSYEKTRKNILSLTPTFIQGNIYQTKLKKTYDNIFLSNIADYNRPEKHRKLVDRLIAILNDNGKMLVAYLYETTEDTLYQQEWSPIYDLEKTLPLFSDTTLENFTGIRGLIFEDEKIVDAALIYQKKNPRR